MRLLAPGEEALLESFLAEHSDSTMLLRSNLRSGGLHYGGHTYQAVYAAAVEGEGEAARVAGVAAHCWNNVLLIQAADSPGLLARAALEASGRPVAGILGPWWQVLEARTALGLSTAPAASEGRDYLYALDIEKLRVPEKLTQLKYRLPWPVDLPILTRWRISYCIETLHVKDTPELRAQCAADVQRFQEEGTHVLLLDGERHAAYSTFPALFQGMCQVGGVYVPKELRGKGYGKCVVAGHLLLAKQTGVHRAILYTSETNTTAQKAYESLGFEMVGEYCMTLFAEPQMAKAGPPVS
ncbi:MAG: GNAT family N-acetyltransferase [Bdellovibrionota bacterium]